MIDLHIHTNASDGQYSPAEVVRLAAQKGATCIAITDHDTVAGLDEARRAANDVGIECIPGIEISVQGNRELHILGYFIDCAHRGLTEACDNFIRLREQRVSRILTYLSPKGVPLTGEQARSHVICLGSCAPCALRFIPHRQLIRVSQATHERRKP